MRRLTTLAIALSVLICACSSQPPSETLDRAAAGAKATTKPATQTAASPLNDYGAERFRAVNQSDEIVSTLKNGMVVIAKRVPSPVVTVRAYVYTGGVYEGRWLGGGLSHLLEHLVAGGSTKNRTEAENRSILQEIGNNSNAYTTSDHTAYFINTTPEHMEKAVDLVTGYMFGALITPQEYQREYEVVQRELEKGKGEPGRQFYYLSALNRYRVSPARVPVIGYQEVIQGLSRDDVYEYYKLTYQPNNMVFVIAGDLPPEKMLAAVQKYAINAAPGREFSRDIPQEPPVVAPRTVVATFPKLGQANLQIAFPTVSLNHPDLYALDLLSAVLSNGESSILVEEIRDKQRLVSGISTGSDTPVYADGSFEVDMRLDPDNIPKATDAVLEELDRVAKEGVSEERLARAKVLVRTGRVKSQQTSEAIASSMAIDFMNTGDPHFTDRYVKRIGETTAAEVQTVAKKYFDRSKLLTTVMLPAEHVGAQGLPKAEHLIRAVAPTTAEAPAVAETKITRHELSNGTILLHKRITTSPLVVMHMYALGGLTAEDAKTNGIGNLTMNLLPRGTTTRSAQQIAEFFDSIGGDLNTGSGNNSFLWTATTMKEDAERAMEVYADVVQNPSFPEDEIAPMKKRIIAAIAGQDADWRAQAFRFFKQKYFGPTNSPYQFVGIGTTENVKAFTREQLQQWYQDKVLRSRRVIAIFGDIELERARSLAEATLGKLPEARGKVMPPPLDAPIPAAPAGETPQLVIERVETQKTEQPLAGVVIGFNADPVIGHPMNYPIIVADTMSSGFGYPTGYLHETLRGRGLVYEVHALNQPGVNPKLPGTFLAYAGCEPRQVNEVVDLMLENIARLQGRDEDMDAGWFDRSKQLAVTADAMDNETPAEQASTAALDELYGMGYDYHDFFGKRVNAVSLDQVRGVAKNRLVKCVVTVSTPLPDLVKAKPETRTYQNFHPVDLTPKAEEREAPQ